MMPFPFACIVCILSLTGKLTEASLEMGRVDGNLNIYMLPVGQGDATVIQCPGGKISILNMGSVYSKSYWNADDVSQFLNDPPAIETIIISRPSHSNYNFLPRVLPQVDNINNVYVVCNKSDYMKTREMKEWLTKLDLDGKVKEISSRLDGAGHPCFDETDCTPVKICGDGSYVDSRILAANLGGCSPVRPDGFSDSLVLHVRFYQFSILFPGDLEDPSTETETLQRDIVDYFARRGTVAATVYKAADHGAWGKANKPSFINAIQPKYIVISNAVPEEKTGLGFSPRCEFMDYLAHRREGSLLMLPTIQPFQCVFSDGSVSTLRRTNRAAFVTAYNDDKGWKVRKVLRISSDGESHLVNHYLVSAR